MKKYYILLISVALNFCATLSYGQCEDARLSKAIKTAEQYFDEGRLEEAVKVLKPALEQSAKKCPTITRNAKVVLSKIYIMDDKEAEAGVIYSEVLLKEPFFKPNSTLEPKELLYFADSYKAIPKWSFDINFSLVKVADDSLPTSNNFVIQEHNELPTLHKGGYTFGANINGSYHFNETFELSLGVGYDSRSLERIHLNYYIKEHQSRFYIPLVAKLNFRKNNLNFNVFGGVEFSRFLNIEFESIYRNLITFGDFGKEEQSTVDLITEIRELNSEPNNDYSIQVDDLSKILDLRNRHTGNVVLGAGLKLSPLILKGNFITLDCKYVFAQWNIDTPPSSLTTNDKVEALQKALINTIGYIDNPIYINHIQLSIGFNYSFYTIKK